MNTKDCIAGLNIWAGYATDITNHDLICFSVIRTKASSQKLPLNICNTCHEYDTDDIRCQSKDHRHHNEMNDLHEF